MSDAVSPNQLKELEELELLPEVDQVSRTGSIASIDFVEEIEDCDGISVLDIKAGITMKKLVAEFASNADFRDALTEKRYKAIFDQFEGGVEEAEAYNVTLDDLIGLEDVLKAIEEVIEVDRLVDFVMDSVLFTEAARSRLRETGMLTSVNDLARRIRHRRLK